MPADEHTDPGERHRSTTTASERGAGIENRWRPATGSSSANDLEYDIVTTPALVIGAGAAGARVAIELAESGLEPLVIGKRNHGDAHTVWAAGGINAALGSLDEDDDWTIHAADTLNEGHHLNDPAAVELTAQEMPDRIHELEEWGTPFDRTDDGAINQRYFGAQSYRRTCFIGDRTGEAILETLIDRAQALEIPYRENVMITRLLSDGDRVSGAVGFDMDTGNGLLFRSDHVVLAAGGFSAVYDRHSSRDDENNGDAQALALEAGARLLDLEFVQFHPTGMVATATARSGTAGSSRRRFVARAVASTTPLASGSWNATRPTRWNSMLATSSLAQLHRRFGKAGERTTAASSSISHTARTSTSASACRRWSNGSTPSRRHHQRADGGRPDRPLHDGRGRHRLRNGRNGRRRALRRWRGRRRRPRCESTRRQLAGRNRRHRQVGREHVAGAITNATLEPNVTADQRALAERELRALTQLEAADGRHTPETLLAELGEILWDHAGILRDESALREGLERLALLRDRTGSLRVDGDRTSRSFEYAVDLSFSLTVADTLFRTALERTESRGAHYRTDHPKTEAGWRVNLLLSAGERGTEIRRRGVGEPSEPVQNALDEGYELDYHHLE